MTAGLRKLLTVLGDTFWLLPGAIVIVGILGALGLVSIDRSGAVPQWLIESPWLYNGGATGARTLLGAIASSTIGVAGTVFSITIAALSLAAGQMGPRLLRNFTRDRGNQITLGAFFGTFCYALMVLRSVRTRSEGEFIPHLALSVGIVIEVLTAVAGYERNPARLAAIRRHADLVLADAERCVTAPSDLADVRTRHRRCMLVRETGPSALAGL